jgi:hypothetical protein
MGRGSGRSDGAAPQHAFPVSLRRLIAAVLGAERWRLVQALLAERVALKPASRISRRPYAEVLPRLGDEAAAGAAPRRATLP